LKEDDQARGGQKMSQKLSGFELMKKPQKGIRSLFQVVADNSLSTAI
jgi:hypothetical protein